MHGRWLLGLLIPLLAGTLVGCASTQGTSSDLERRVYLLTEVDRPPRIAGGYVRIDSLKGYPEPARRDRAAGTILVEGVVSATGAPTRLRIIEGGHPALEGEALRVIRDLRFEPALKDDAPFPARIQIPIFFERPVPPPTTPPDTARPA